MFCKILVDCIHGFFCWLKRSILDIFAFMFSFECYWRRIITYLRWNDWILWSLIWWIVVVHRIKILLYMFVLELYWMLLLLFRLTAGLRGCFLFSWKWWLFYWKHVVSVISRVRKNSLWGFPSTFGCVTMLLLFIEVGKCEKVVSYSCYCRWLLKTVKRRKRTILDG